MMEDEDEAQVTVSLDVQPGTGRLETNFLLLHSSQFSVKNKQKVPISLSLHCPGL
jgi:hypothetical protein